MPNEDDEEIPEWEIEPEKVPDSLKEKWLKEEGRGLAAALCPKCGTPFTQAHLACPHCGAFVVIPSARGKTFRSWFLNTPVGLAVFTLIVAGIILYLVQ